MKKLRCLLLVMLFTAVTVMAEKPAKYVFLMIGDGMGPEFTRLYMQMYPESNFSRFAKRIPTGTDNVYGKTTDSAASGTALACGIKTYNGAIGVDKDGNPRSSLARRLQARNWKIGVVSSVAINDATPGAHFGNRLIRKDRAGILSDLFASNYDFFGISKVAMPKEFRTRDLAKMFRRSGYTMVKSKEIDTLKPGNRNIVFGVSEYHQSHAPEIPLAKVTAKAAELLSAGGKNFFLVVEGGAIDHCNHRNDSAFAIREMMEFDAAIGEALKFAEKYPEETLIVVTADHDTGGTKILDISKARKDFYKNQKKSLGELTEMVVKMKAAKASVPEMIRAVTDAVGVVNISPEDGAKLENACKQFISGKRTKTDKFTASMGYGKYNPLVVEALRIRDRRNGFTYTSFGHTQAKVITFVKGAGAGYFAVPLENSDIPHRIAAAAGLAGMLEKEGAFPPFPVRSKIADHVDLQTVTATSATLRYGFNQADKRAFTLSSGVSKTVNGFFGRVTFDNLKPDTEYTITTPLKKTVRFRTQKLISGKPLLKAGVMSDPHLTTFPDNGVRLHSRSQALASGLVKKFNAQKVDFILVPGDVTDKGRVAEIGVAAEAFKKAKMPVIFTRGNHDHVQSEKTDGKTAGTGENFEFIIHHGVKFNQSHWIKNFGRPSGLIVKNGVQIAWLNTPFGILDLPENAAVINKIDEKLPLIIFSHYQLFPDSYVAAKDNSSAIGETRGKKSIAQAPEGARRMLEKLARCKGLILVGHKNVATSVKLGSMTQINMPQTTEYPAGGIALEVYEHGAGLTFVPIADTFAEEYTRRRIAESASRLRHRTRYTYPVWNQFVAF